MRNVLALLTALVLAVASPSVALAAPPAPAAAAAGPAPDAAPAAGATVPPIGPLPALSAIGGPLLASSGLVLPAGAPPLPPLTAASWVLADLDTGEVLAAQDPHGRYLPASTLKVLTALTLLPEMDPELLVTPTWEDVNIEGSKVGIVQEVAYPLRELFEALLMVSGNDAAHALATANGGMARTTAQMNAVAAELGAADTYAVNTSGLDGEGQLTSAYDLALIGRAAMELPEFRRIVSTRRSSISAPGGARFELYTKNKLLRNYEGTIGIKNGYTDAARGTFVGAAERDGRRLVATFLKADPRVWAEAATLLDWGFAAPTGLAPVGTLVVPGSEPAPDPAPTQVGGAAPLGGPVTASGPVDAGGLGALPLPPTPVGAAALLLAGGVLARRRQLRQRRTYPHTVRRT